MDKLVKHGIRMLEIVEGENDFFRNDAKRQADIARAVYDVILRVQMLERNADRKTEPTISKMEQVEEPIDRDDLGNCNICKYVGLEHRCNQCVNGSMFCKVEDEPQTDCSWK